MVCPSCFRGTALACLIAFSWPVFAGASAAPVSRVVLYPGSALVERTASVRAGDQSLDIPGLPANFDADSVQIEADAGIEVGEVVWRDSARSAPLNAEEARLEKEVRRLGDRLGSLDAERKTAELMLKYLDTLASPSDAGPAANPARTLETLHQGSLQAQRRVLEIDQQKRDLDRELLARQRDLERIRPAVAEVRNLLVRLNARNDGRVRVRYLFADAGWRPAYRAALDSESGKVELERIAQIAQRSGEDWSQVSLQLSTGQPRQRVAGPQPYSWGLSLQQPERRAEAVAYAASPASPAPAAMRAKGAPDAARPLFEAAVVQGEYATEYVIPGAVSLPADGRKVAVSLGRSQIPVALQAQVSPRQEKAAYLVASGNLPEGVWPAGEMQFYRNGAYIGTSAWDASRSNKLELPFGRDELIRVSSRSLAADNASAGFAGQKSERRIADVFTVTNRHKRPVDVRVLDASPVSQDGEIEVESRFVPPVATKDWNERRGVVAWEQRVEAGAAAEFTADYRIRWPKERRVVGLP